MTKLWTRCENVCANTLTDALPYCSLLCRRGERFEAEVQRKNHAPTTRKHTRTHTRTRASVETLDTHTAGETALCI